MSPEECFVTRSLVLWLNDKTPDGKSIITSVRKYNTVIKIKFKERNLIQLIQFKLKNSKNFKLNTKTDRGGTYS